MKKLKFVSLLIVFFLVAAVLIPTPAAAKSDCQQNGWEVLYTLQFPPAYWTAGQHENDLKVVDESGTTLVSFIFQSTEDSPIYPGQVRLGFWGIHSIDIAGLDEINPAQDTFMQVSQTNFVSREDAQAYADSAVVQFSWDGGDWVTISPGPVNCAPNAWSGQKGYYHRKWSSH
jgi:hypothetical protein